MSDSFPTELPPIDVPALYDRCMSDSAFVKEILELFREQVTKNVEALSKAVEGGDNEAVWKLAHAIKGSASNLSADRLSQLYYEIELSARENKLDSTRAMLPEARVELDRVLAFFPVLLRQVESIG